MSYVPKMLRVSVAVLCLWQSSGASSADRGTVLSQEKRCEAKRPGTYGGTKVADLGTIIVWRSGADGSACGTGCWYEVPKKAGDKITSKNKCTGGDQAYEIQLVQ
jgi:hypothetical protein